MNLTKRFRVEPGTKVRLADWETDAHPGLDGKEEGKERLAENVARLQDLQYLLYAEGERALLVVLQAMDAGGKDGTVRHVFGPLNPQGVRVTSFTTPTAEELTHDFLWRVHKVAPRKGMIGVFNRSHYEDVLIVRVHDLVPKDVWSRRYDQINAFEETLASAGVTILKLFLHISKEEQLERFRKRLEKPKKRWKFSPADFEEREHWDAYRKAYEAVLARCSTPCAPWHVVPADRKWYRNAAVSQILRETLEGMDLAYPEPAVDLSQYAVEV
jgi:PPK2 family polyphosphate:nucleotide phosphotransferase